MCDHINAALVKVLFDNGEEDTNVGSSVATSSSGDVLVEAMDILAKFRLSQAKIRTIIKGPEFLKYKDALKENIRRSSLVIQ